VHATFGGQTLDTADVAFRPVAPGSPAGEPLEVGRLIPTPVLAVDPTVGDGLKDGVLVVEGRRPGRALLGQDEPDPLLPAVMLDQPGPPAGDVLQNEFGEIGWHRPILSAVPAFSERPRRAWAAAGDEPVGVGRRYVMGSAGERRPRAAR